MDESINKLLAALEISEQERKEIKVALTLVIFQNALGQRAKDLESREVEKLSSLLDTNQVVDNREKLLAEIFADPKWKSALEKAADEEISGFMETIVENTDANSVQKILKRLSP